MELPTTMRSPNSWVSSLLYGVSPQPEHAPENSINGCWNWLPLTENLSTRSSRTGRVSKNSQLGTSAAVWVASGFITRALILAGQMSAQLSHPMQSSVSTCMRK